MVTVSPVLCPSGVHGPSQVAAVSICHVVSCFSIRTALALSGICRSPAPVIDRADVLAVPTSVPGWSSRLISRTRT